MQGQFILVRASKQNLKNLRVNLKLRDKREGDSREKSKISKECSLLKNQLLLDTRILIININFKND